MPSSLLPLWKGSAFVIGGGPSVSDVDFSLLEGKNVVATNNAYRLAPWAPVLYFMDCEWYKWHCAEIASFTGLKITTCSSAEGDPGILYLAHGKRQGIDERSDHLVRGSSSGFGGEGVAAALGAKEICLIGFDMRIVEGKHNYHEDHKRSVSDKIYADSHLKSFQNDVFKNDLKRLGITLWNSTPDSALTDFPYKDWKELL